MDEKKSVISGEFDRTGRYDSGLQSLARTLRAAFLILLLGIIGTLIYFFTGAGYFSVEPQQAVVVLRFGRVAGTYTTGGHWFLPFPVNRFVRLQTSQQLLHVDFVPGEQLNEQMLNSLEPGRDCYQLTGDANIVHSSWTIAYRVANPELFYLKLLSPADPVVNGKVMPDEIVTDADGMQGTRGPQTFLQNLFRRAVITVSARSQVGEILYAGQGSYSNAVQQEFTRLVQKAECGIEIDNVGLNRIYPPLKTKAAFDAVTAASNTRSQLYNEAVAYKVSVENETLASIAEIRAAAETYRLRVIAKGEAQKIYFEKIREQYRRHDDTVPMALYTAALADIAGELQGDRFILGTGGKKKQLWLKLNPEPRKSSGEKSANEEEK